MRISGTEPSLVILSQTNNFKKLKKNDAQKLPKQAKAKRNGVISPPPQKKKIEVGRDGRNSKPGNMTRFGETALKEGHM